MSPVYVVQNVDTGHVKIGFAQDVQRRVMQLRVGSSSELDVLRVIEDGDVALERELHERFRSHRLRGEWFTPARALIAWANEGERPRGRAFTVSFAFRRAVQQAIVADLERDDEKLALAAEAIMDCSYAERPFPELLGLTDKAWSGLVRRMEAALDRWEEARSS